MAMPLNGMSWMDDSEEKSSCLTVLFSGLERTAHTVQMVLGHTLGADRTFHRGLRPGRMQELMTS